MKSYTQSNYAVRKFLGSSYIKTFGRRTAPHRKISWNVTDISHPWLRQDGTGYNELKPCGMENWDCTGLEIRSHDQNYISVGSFPIAVCATTKSCTSPRLNFCRIKSYVWAASAVGLQAEFSMADQSQKKFSCQSGTEFSSWDRERWPDISTAEPSVISAVAARNKVGGPVGFPSTLRYDGGLFTAKYYTKTSSDF